MAFVEVASWRAEAGAGAGSATAVPLPPWIDALLRDGGAERLRRGLSIVLSAVVHVALIWVLANRLAGGIAPAVEPPRPIGAMSVMDLAPIPDPGAVASSKAPAAPAGSAVKASEIDVSAPAQLPAPEWSVSRLAAAAPVSPTPEPAQAASSGFGSAGSGAGAGGGYDPFAGAAPLRREEAPPGLDPALLESVRQAVLKQLPGARGTAHLVILLSSTGVVVRVDARSGDASPQTLAALRSVLVGKTLAVGAGEAGTRIIALPPMSFG